MHFKLGCSGSTIGTRINGSQNRSFKSFQFHLIDKLEISIRMQGKSQFKKMTDFNQLFPSQALERWDGVMGGFRPESQCGQKKMPTKTKKKTKKKIESFQVNLVTDG